MVNASKHLQQRQFVKVLLANTDCTDVIHPWTSSCVLAALDMMMCAFKGSFRNLLQLHLLQLMLKGRKISREYLKNHLKAFVQSIFFGSVVAGTWVGTSCFCRAIIGRYHLYTAVCMPAVLSTAITIHLERPVRRNLYAYTFFQAALEYMVRVLEVSGIGPMSRNNETLVFMICNGALLYLLKNTKSHGVAYWFFRPPSASTIAENENVGTRKKLYCPHTEPCWKYIMKSVAQYTGAGIGIQFLRAVITKYQHFLKTPSQTFRSVMWNRNMFQLGAFLGVYIGIFKFVSCILCRYRKRDADWHALVAGVASGSAYYIHPERAFALSAATSTLQLLINRGIQLSMLPDIPYAAEFTFALCCGVLFQARFLDAENCPRIITNIIGTVTKGRADYIYRMYTNRANEFLSLLSM